MSYKLHNFVSGMKLTGAAMAEVDEQIAENETNITALQNEMDGVSGRLVALIRQLSIRSDSNTMLFEYGPVNAKQTLSAIPIAYSGTVVLCTGLTASASLENINVGDTVQISANITPENCNEFLYFVSGDPDIVTVTTTGLATAISSGSTTITVGCGSESRTLNVSVKKQIKLAGKVADVNWMSMSGFNNIPGATYDCSDGANTLLGLIPYDFDMLKIENGEKITIAALNGWRIRHAYIVSQIAGSTMEAQDFRTNTQPRYLISNTEEVAKSTSAVTSYEFTNTTGKTCYLVCTIEYRNTTLEEALENVDSNIQISIGPAET